MKTGDKVWEKGETKVEEEEGKGTGKGILLDEDFRGSEEGGVKFIFTCLCVGVSVCICARIVFVFL